MRKLFSYSRKERRNAMEKFSLQHKAQRVTRFILVQFCALAGWILVQLFFSLSPLGRTLSFSTIMVIEAIWWMALLLLMLRLFLHEYNRFVQAALALEDANARLRKRTNSVLEYMRAEHFPEASDAAQSQDSFVQESPANYKNRREPTL